MSYSKSWPCLFSICLTHYSVRPGLLIYRCFQSRMIFDVHESDGQVAEGTPERAA